MHRRFRACDGLLTGLYRLSARRPLQPPVLTHDATKNPNSFLYDASLYKIYNCSLPRFVAQTAIDCQWTSKTTLPLPGSHSTSQGPFIAANRTITCRGPCSSRIPSAPGRGSRYISCSCYRALPGDRHRYRYRHGDAWAPMRSVHVPRTASSQLRLALLQHCLHCLIQYL